MLSTQKSFLAWAFVGVLGAGFFTFSLGQVQEGQQDGAVFEQTTPILTPTDDRILRLLEVGNTMLTDSRTQQAFNHYQTFALQFPGNGPLMQAWALAARSANEEDTLLDLAKFWDGQEGRPTREMAAFVKAYVQLFDVSSDMPPAVLDRVLSDIRAQLLTQGLNVQASSNLQLLLAMIALRESDNEGSNLIQASQWIERAASLDPRDPAVGSLNRVVDYLLRSQELLQLKRPLSNQEVAQARLELGAIESSFLPNAIRERSGALIQVLVLQQDRDRSMPREYLRGLSNVIALTELGNDGVLTAARTWEEAAQDDAFRRSPTFQEYGLFLGRYQACYDNMNDGLNMLNRVQAIQAEYSDFSTASGRATAEQRLRTLVLLWRFAIRARFTEEAGEYRDQAVQLAERLAKRSRRDLVDGSWVPMTWGLGFVLGLVAFLFLVGRDILTQRAIIRPRGRGQPPLGGEELALRRKVAAVQTRLIMKKALWSASVVACVVAVSLGLGCLLMWALSHYQPEAYREFFTYTNTTMLAALAVGGSLFTGVLVGVFMAGRQSPSALELASEIDKKLGLGGVAETIFGMDQMAQVSGRQRQSIYENAYLSVSLPKVCEAISPGRLVGFWLPALLLGLILGLSGAASASFQVLPLPNFEAVELPHPQICPPPYQSAHSPPPSVQLTQPQMQGGAEDGRTGLDVANSRVPEDQIEELEKQLGVGGTDDVGEPFDYHTTLPSREFEVQRNSDGARGLGQAATVPEGFGGAARQDVPERFLGL